MKASRTLIILGATTGFLSSLLTFAATLRWYFLQGHSPLQLLNLLAAIAGLFLSWFLLKGSRLAATGLLLLLVLPKVFYPPDTWHPTSPYFLTILVLLGGGLLGASLLHRQIQEVAGVPNNSFKPNPLRGSA